VTSQRGAKLNTQSPKKPKKRKVPLENVLRQMHEAINMVFDYDHDPDFVPSADQLVLFEVLHKQVVGFTAMSHIIVDTMRRRAKEAAEAEIVAGLKTPPE
jgi:hypothetical protein